MCIFITLESLVVLLALVFQEAVLVELEEGLLCSLLTVEKGSGVAPRFNQLRYTSIHPKVYN